MAGDRLEPTPNMLDVGCGFDELVASGESFTATFWRSSSATVARRRNPLFEEETGITLDRVLAVDWLHCLSLGAFGAFLNHLVREMIKANVRSTAETSADESVNSEVRRDERGLKLLSIFHVDRSRMLHWLCQIANVLA